MPPEHCHAELAGAAPRPSGPENTCVTNLPAPHDIVRMTCLLREHQRWSLFWDPR